MLNRLFSRSERQSRMMTTLKSGLLYTLCALVTFSVTGTAQTDAGKPLIVPFTPDRNRVIVPTSVNGSRPLKLILDTGMRFDGVYLFHKDAVNFVDMTGAVQVQVGGAGSGDASRATMIETGKLTFGDVAIGNQRIIISYSEQTQSFPTDGVIGWNLFGHYLVEIDYDHEVILLHDTSQLVPDAGWQVIPLEMKQGLPFLQAAVEVTAGEVVPMTIYIDLASEEALELLVHDQQKFTMPDSLIDAYLGTGLSGDVHGQRGEVLSVTIGEFTLRDLRAAFAPAKVRSKQEGADGIFGNNLLRRFNVIFDYPHKRLYIKPNTTFGEPFE